MLAVSDDDDDVALRTPESWADSRRSFCNPRLFRTLNTMVYTPKRSDTQKTIRLEDYGAGTSLSASSTAGRRVPPLSISRAVGSPR